jgi:hypothetical protein
VTQLTGQGAAAGLWRDAAAKLAAPFEDGEGTALLGEQARRVTIAPGESVWLGFGLRKPAGGFGFETIAEQTVAYLNGAGATITYTDRLKCTYATGIYKFIDLGIQPYDTYEEHSRMEVEQSLAVGLEGVIHGEIDGSSKADLFDGAPQAGFYYSAMAEHAFDERSFTLPPSVCP